MKRRNLEYREARGDLYATITRHWWWRGFWMGCVVGVATMAIIGFML